MNFTKNTDKHLNHKISFQIGIIPTKSPTITHYGKIICTECNKHVQWISKFEASQITQYKNLIKTYNDFLKLKRKLLYIKPDPNTTIYLVIGYKNRHIAKENDCNYDTVEKLWYTKIDNPKNNKLYDYMMPDDRLWAKNYRVINWIE